MNRYNSISTCILNCYLRLNAYLYLVFVANFGDQEIDCKNGLGTRYCGRKTEFS